MTKGHAGTPAVLRAVEVSPPFKRASSQVLCLMAAQPCQGDLFQGGQPNLEVIRGREDTGGMSFPDRALPMPQHPAAPMDFLNAGGGAPTVTAALHLLRAGAEHAKRGQQQQAFEEVGAAAHLSDAPRVRAYAAVLFATWHKQGIVRFEPVASRAQSPAIEADVWSVRVLTDIKAGKGPACDDAELMALSVQLLLHVRPPRFLAFLVQRIVLLVCTGNFQHDETAAVLRELVVPQLVCVGLAAEADLALIQAYLLLERCSPPSTSALQTYAGN